MTLLIPLLAMLAAAPEPVEGNVQGRMSWPRTFNTDKGIASVYTPQIEGLNGDQLSARAAVSLQPMSASFTQMPAGDPSFGVAFFTATIEVDREAGWVQVESIKVTRLRFPGLSKEQETKSAERLGAEMTRWDLSFPLELMLASLEVAGKAANTPGLKSAPPKILAATEPTVLITLDGEPKLGPVEGAPLQRVLNTRFLILLDTAGQKYFLTSGAAWFSAPEVKGPWTSVAAPSADVATWFAKNPPPPPGDDAAPPPVKPAAFVVATEPTELVQFDGKPAWNPLAGVGLLSATNTDADIYMELETQKLYLLLAGRWFAAPRMEGPWKPIQPDKLPKAFSKIPPDSEEAYLLAFVSGTPQAEDAIADAQVPTTATVRKDAGKNLKVAWDGEPQFKAIEGTTLSYGVNTESAVLQIHDQYWVCDQAVWYLGASPKGPWIVSTLRPPGVDGLPPSAPVYNVKYVYIYDEQPDVVVVGYLPGYLGAYPYHGVVVYGTGYYYPPYIGPSVYYPPPATFGVGVHYNPWMGWGVGVSYGTPYLRVGIYFGGMGCYGPYGYRPIPPPYYRPGYPPVGHRPPYGGGPGYRPPSGQPGSGARPGTLPSTRPGGPGNLYQRPGNAGLGGGRPSTQPMAPSSMGGGANNLYGGRNGEVYRPGAHGGWEQRSGNGWSNSSSRPQSSQLNHDAAARQRGGMGGGGARGGGGMRGGGGGGRGR